MFPQNENFYFPTESGSVNICFKKPVNQFSKERVLSIYKTARKKKKIKD